MKTSILVASMVMMATIGLGQKLFPTLWKTGKSKIILGHEILREQGNGRSSPYIYFESYEQKLADLEKKASVQMWAEEDKKQKIESLTKYGKGGSIGVKTFASSLDEAKVDNFTMIVQDMDGKELYRSKLKEEVPSYSVVSWSTSWGSFAVEYLPENIKTPFRLYLVNSYYSDEKYSKVVYLIKK